MSETVSSEPGSAGVGVNPKVLAMLGSVASQGSALPPLAALGLGGVSVIGAKVSQEAIRRTLKAYFPEDSDADLTKFNETLTKFTEFNQRLLIDAVSRDAKTLQQTGPRSAAGNDVAMANMFELGAPVAESIYGKTPATVAFSEMGPGINLVAGLPEVLASREDGFAPDPRLENVPTNQARLAEEIEGILASLAERAVQENKSQIVLIDESGPSEVFSSLAKHRLGLTEEGDDADKLQLLSQALTNYCAPSIQCPWGAVRVEGDRLVVEPAAVRPPADTLETQGLAADDEGLGVWSE